MNPSSNNDPADTLDLARTLARLVQELHESASSCSALQWSISSLLDKVHHPDLAEEIHMLQDIDRLQQTIMDIAAVLHVASGIHDRIPLSRDEVGYAIRLESFRSRIGLGSGLEHPDARGVFGQDVDDSDVTWL